MMATIRMAHLRAQGIDFCVFAADAPSRLNQDRARLLLQLTQMARRQGLKVDKSALAYVEFGETHFYGTPDLVGYLSTNGVSTWTHRLAT